MQGLQATHLPRPCSASCGSAHPPRCQKWRWRRGAQPGGAGGTAPAPPHSRRAVGTSFEEEGSVERTAEAWGCIKSTAMLAVWLCVHLCDKRLDNAHLPRQGGVHICALKV